jgi:predicted GH43/DUF377 family glycosyl hydrolase
VQLGNCGSPIETDAGWLVLTHGVGSIRRYAIRAVLLDINNPGRVIGRLPEPLLEPIPEERDGYVPNVVYSCGALVHADFHDGARIWSSSAGQDTSPKGAKYHTDDLSRFA